MLVKEPKYRRPVGSNQLRLLQLLFKFRFVTTDLLVPVIKKDRSTVYESLYVLEKQGYVLKFHDKTYRLRGKPAVYCLASKGIRYLRENTKYNETTLRNFYKNKRMAVDNEEHVDLCLLVFKIFNILKAQTGDKFYIYSKYELTRGSYVSPHPELYLHRRGRSQKPDYILDIFPAGTMTWLLRKRLRQHQDYADDSEYLYPNVLLVAGNMSTEKRLFKQVESAMQDFEFFVTQQAMLLGENDGKIWIDIDESDENEFGRIISIE